MSLDTQRPDTEADPAQIEQVSEQLIGTYTAGLLTYMIDIAHRTGLLEAAAAGAGTSADLAGRAGLSERYVRECLGALVTGGLVEYDAAAGTYRLPPAQAACLTGDSSLNLAPYSRLGALLARYVDAVAECFRTGGGVPYEAFRPEFTDVMDGLGRGLYDAQLRDGILPLTGDLPARLAAGARVADIGCGTGHTTNLLAQAFPDSQFLGFDLAADAIARARAEAEAYGLRNVAFEVCDIATLPTEPGFDAVFAFDVIHDQVNPAGVLAQVHAALAPDGRFVMLDIKASSRLERNLDNPFAPWLYAISTLHCMTVSLAHDGAGLGTAWGQELALTMLAEAGFVDVRIHDVPDDPFNSVYLAHKRA